MNKSHQFKFRAWNRIVARMQDFSFKDIEHFAGEIAWDNLEFMQYSATEDIDKNLICEGDIINVKHKAISLDKGNDYEVVFDGNRFTLISAKREVDKYGVFTRNFPLYTDIYKKIGTIYQNPELLK